MDKKKKAKKGKTINEKVNKETDKVIKEKIMNKEETPLKNAQTIDLKMEEKEPQITPEETTEKTPEKTPEVNTDDLINVLKVPMQEATLEEMDNDSGSVKDAIFDDPEDDVLEPDIEEEENLNDKYFKEKESEDDFDGTFFEDEELMSEMAVELIDLGMQTLAQSVAGDFDNPEKYAVSDYKKKKIKKPLTLLLRKRGTKVSPEIMFGVVLLVVYSPVMILAVQDRKAKKKKQQEAQQKAKKKKMDVANSNIPSNIIEVDHEEIMRRQQPPPPPQETITPMVVPKSKGRPKGSKDSKKRKTGGYKGNKNAQ